MILVGERTGRQNRELVEPSGRPSSEDLAWYQTFCHFSGRGVPPAPAFFPFPGSTALTENLSERLMVALIDSSQITAASWHVRMRELTEFDKMMRRLLAIEAVAGLLNDLDDHQLAEFDRAISRRPLFDNGQLSD